MPAPRLRPLRRSPSLLSAAVALLLSAAAALLAAPASANGKFPAAGQILVDPGDASHIVVRTTFGILVSRDAGATFDWICESGAGYAGNMDPGIALTAHGTILAGLVDGLDVGRGDACTFQLAGGVLAGQSVIDVSILKSSPDTSFALVAGATGNSVYRSPDDAVTWAMLGSPLPAQFQAITLDVAPSDPSRIYLSGVDKTAGLSASFARSKDGGGTWEVVAIAAATTRAPYLAAVDPVDPDVVYVRLDGTPGELLVTRDAGDTWTSVLTIPGYIQAFALAPDGATVLAGGPTAGIWRAPATTYAFERVSSKGVQCLHWSGAGVYACGIDFAVGRSLDEGATVQSLLRLECLRGPLACDPSTPVGAQCPAEWSQIMVKLGSMYCQADAGTPTGGTGGSATSGGSGGGGGGTAPHDGCNCRTGGEAPSGGAAALLGVAAALGVRRRAAEKPRGARRRDRSRRASL